MTTWSPRSTTFSPTATPHEPCCCRPLRTCSLGDVTRRAAGPSTRPRRRPGAAGRTPRASAPGSRWPSRRWRGWSVRSSHPCTATTRSCTTRSWCERFEDLGVVFVDDIDEVPAGRPVMLSRPRLCPRGRAGRPRRRWIRGRRRVPAGHQGPPRGQGAGRQGLPDRLRRPRGPRGGSRHDGRGTASRSTGSRASRRSTRCPSSRPRSRCSPRPRCRTATGPTSADATRRALSRGPVDAGTKRPLLRHHQPPDRASWRSRRSATPWS